MKSILLKKMIHILLVDDQQNIRRGLISLFEYAIDLLCLHTQKMNQIAPGSKFFNRFQLLLESFTRNTLQQDFSKSTVGYQKLNFNSTYSKYSK